MDVNIQSKEYADALSSVMNQLGTAPESIENLATYIENLVEEPESFIMKLKRSDNIPIEENDNGDLYRTDLSYRGSK